MFYRFFFIILFLTLSLWAQVNVETKYLVDKEHKYSIENIYENKNKFISINDNSFGLRKDTIWTYIKVKNQTKDTKNNIIQFKYALLDNIHVLKYENNKLVKSYLTGDLHPFNSREVHTNDFVIPIELKAFETKELIFKINTDGAYNLGTKLISLEKYTIESKNEQTGLGFYYGATIVMLLYNLILFLMIKERVYMDYIVFHFVFLFLQLGLNGLAFQYLWPNIPSINLYYVPVGLFAANYFSIQFTQSFLEILKHSKKIYNYFQIFKVIWLITLVLIFITPYAFIIKVIAYLSIITLSSSFAFSIYLYVKYRTIEAKFYLFAWSFILIGTLFTEFQNIGLLPVNYITLYGSQIGAFFELVLLSLALAYRYNILFLKLSDTEANLRVLNKELENKVDERTKDLELKQLELKQLNDSLEHRVSEAIKDTKTKEKMLQQQSKLASMGEMIGSIAHQWRQPLAVSNIIVSILKERNDMNKLDKGYAEKKLDEIESTNLYLSQTIEDFLSFFSPNKKKEIFHLNDALNKSIYIINNLIEKENVKIHINLENDLKINGFKDEYIQVILSILTNAITALESHENKQIYINANKEKDDIILTISDTAGGIPEEIIDRIFEPYFTTKHQSKGTGLGLYISRMIIETSMQGTLDVENTKDGARFTIICKKG